MQLQSTNEQTEGQHKSWTLILARLPQSAGGFARKHVVRLRNSQHRLVAVCVVGLVGIAGLVVLGLGQRQIDAVSAETRDRQWCLSAYVPKQDLVEDNFAVIRVSLRYLGNAPVTIVPGIQFHSKLELLNRKPPKGSPPLMVRTEPSEPMRPGEQRSWWDRVPGPGWDLPAGVIKVRVSIEAPYITGGVSRMLALRTGTLVLSVGDVPQKEKENWRILCRIRQSMTSNRAAREGDLDWLFSARPRSIYLPLAVHYFQMSCGGAASFAESASATLATEVRNAGKDAGLRYLRDPASIHDLEWIVDQIAGATTGFAYSVKDYDTATTAARRCSPENRHYCLERVRKAIETGTNENEISLARQREGVRKGELISKENKARAASLNGKRLTVEANATQVYEEIKKNLWDLGGTITPAEQPLVRPEEEIKRIVREAKARGEVHDGMGDLTTDKVKTGGALWFELMTEELKKVVAYREANKKKLGLNREELKKKRTSLSSQRMMQAIRLEADLINSGGRFTEEEKKLLRSDKEKAAEIERAFQAGELHDGPIDSYCTDKLETRISYQMKLNLDDLKKVKEFREKKRKDSGRK